GRQTLRTRHSHCCVVKRTSNRTVGKCSDAKPGVDTNQDKHGDSGGEQSDLTHVTLCILGRMQASSIRCAGMLPPSQPLARPNPRGPAATRLAVALDRLGGAKIELAGGGRSPLAKMQRNFEIWLSHCGLCPLYPQKRTLVERVAMSALCQNQTRCAAAKWALFDHLVGTGEQCRRHGEPKRLCGLEIDYQLIFGR